MFFLFPELVQERPDFLKTKATGDLDKVEEGQALLPPSPRPSSVELPGSAVPDFVSEKPQPCRAPARQAAGSPPSQGTPN